MIGISVVKWGYTGEYWTKELYNQIVFLKDMNSNVKRDLRETGTVIVNIMWGLMRGR